jgi:hypothetical protein
VSNSSAAKPQIGEHFIAAFRDYRHNQVAWSLALTDKNIFGLE